MEDIKTFAPLGEWFRVRNGFMCFSYVCDPENEREKDGTPVYLFALGWPHFPAVDEAGREKAPQGQEAPVMVGIISPDSALNVLETYGYDWSYYLTDQEDGSEPSETMNGRGCYMVNI